MGLDASQARLDGSSFLIFVRYNVLRPCIVRSGITRGFFWRQDPLDTTLIHNKMYTSSPCHESLRSKQHDIGRARRPTHDAKGLTRVIDPLQELMVSLAADAGP